MSDFTSLSNRLYQADYYDYLDVLNKMLNFIESTELIKGYIDECGGFNADVEQVVDAVMTRYSTFRFSIDDKEEVSDIYSIIKIVCNRNYNQFPRGLLEAYSSSHKYSDKLKEFNHRVVFVLINYIENHLKKVGIEMGLDNNVTYNINGTQVNIANDNSTINAVQNNGIDGDKLKELVKAMRDSISNELNAEDRQEANASIDVIERELQSETPNEETVKTHFKLLKRIDSGVKFASACCSLLTFAGKVYPYLSAIAEWFKQTM